MEVQAMAVPAGGISLDECQNLFFVELRGLFQVPEKVQRRAFVDLGEAIQFIGGRAAKLSAFLAPIGLSAEAATFGLVEEVFESNISKTYLLKFSNTPSVLVRCSLSAHKGEFEPYRRVYPPAGPDV